MKIVVCIKQTFDTETKIVGKDLASRLALRLGVGMASDCTGMEYDANSYLAFKRPIYAGKAFAHIELFEVVPLLKEEFKKLVNE